MMKISEALNQEELSRLARNTISIGDVYEITMTEANGITPKAGDSSRDKYFIVLGFDSNGMVYGGVIINSRINSHLPPHLKMFQPIRQSKYPFLRYDSFVDCVRLKIASPYNFQNWRHLGKIDEYDISLIIGTIKESPVENAAKLASFGL